MKKILITLIMPLVFACAHKETGQREFVIAARYRTYEVVGVTETTVTIKDKYGNVLVLNKDPKDYKIGDKVRYNKKTNRLRKKHPKRVY